MNHPNPVADADDWITVARYADPTQAMVVQGCLQAAGVPVAVADVHTLQMHALLAGAIPARVQVPSRWEPQALAVLAAFERGDFALSDGEILQATQPNEPKESGDDNTV